MGHLYDVRHDYSQEPLSADELGSDPLAAFNAWYADAQEACGNWANVMTLATANADAEPHARIVLLKSATEAGLSFFGGTTSKKSEDLAENPRAALVFFWRELERQVRVEGSIEMLPAADSAAYFASRPEASRTSAWGTPQSQPVADRKELETNVAKAAAEHNTTEKPSWWGGWILKPNRYEFWQGGPGRLHDRITYTCQGDEWVTGRLSP